MIIAGNIIDYDGKALKIVAPLSEIDAAKMFRQQVNECEIRLDDGRTISPQQRRYIYAMLRDISAYTGHMSEELKDHFKAELIVRTGADWFSLASCSVTTANELIELLIQFCLEWSIPTLDNLAGFAPDITKYVYMCLMAKKCACCGQKAELHHAEDRVGMGRNRKEIIHLGMRAMPLCRQHHTECHTIGQQTFNDKWKVYGVMVDADIAKVWKLKKE